MKYFQVKKRYNLYNLISNKYFKDLKEIEKQLIIAAKNIQEYTNIKVNLGADSNIKKSVDQSTIDREVSKYKGLNMKYDKSYNTMNQVLSLLTTLVENEDSGSKGKVYPISL